jgi:hypothetical protein
MRARDEQARHEILFNQKEHRPGNILRAAFMLDQSGLNGLLFPPSGSDTGKSWARSTAARGSRRPNPAGAKRKRLTNSSFDIRHSFVIRASSFVNPPA